MKNQLTQGLLIATLILTGIHSANAQTASGWTTLGNAAGASDILGTTTNQPLNFHTNNTLRMVLSATGSLRIVSLSGTGNRLLMSSSTGQLQPLAAGTASQVLYGNGTWGNLPAGASLWSVGTGTSGITNTNGGQVSLNPNFSVNSNGGFKSNAFVGSGNRLLQTDALGNVSSLAGGAANQVLFGNGTWGSIPTPTVAGVWNVSGSSLYANGFVGINKSNPTVALDVLGDLRVSNNLYVGGGIIVADAMRADTLYMPPGSVVQGNTNVNGNLTIAPNQTLVAGGDVIANGKLNVTGNATFNGALTASQGILFDNTNGFKLTTVPSGSTTSNVFVLGKQTGAIIPLTGTCPNPNNASWFLNNGGGFISAVNGQAAPYQNVNASVKLYTGSWNGDGFMEVEGTDASGATNNGLFLNYFCGRNVEINTGPKPGLIKLGPTVNAYRNINLGYNASPYDLNNAFNVNMAYPSGPSNGIAFYSSSSASKVLSLYTPASSPFNVFGDGQTEIGSGEMKVVLGPLPNSSALGFGTSYIGFNATRQSSGSWTAEGDLSHNGGGTIFGDVNGNLYFSTLVSTGGNSQSLSDANVASKARLILQSTGSAVLNTSGLTAASNAFVVKDIASANTNFLIKPNGYTEINVYSPNAMPQPQNGSPRAFAIIDRANNKDLFVVNSNGKAYAREVEISLVTTFPDYVFAKDYKLKSLPEVEQYIKANHHLPNFEKGSHYESNGINVTDLLLKQQQTIEELMLYNIALEKRLKALEEKNTNATH